MCLRIHFGTKPRKITFSDISIGLFVSSCRTCTVAFPPSNATCVKPLGFFQIYEIKPKTYH